MDERKSAETPSIVEQNIANASHLISWKAKEEILGIFHVDTSSQVQFNIFIYKTKLVYAFGFHESAIFFLEYIKVCLCQLEFKFPILYEWWSNSLPPGQEKASNARGMLGGDIEALIWLVHYYVGFEDIFVVGHGN